VTEPTEEELKALRKTPKWKALQRLKQEGREDAFRTRQQNIRNTKKVPRDEAFYLALFEFPPLE
jgi:hypothetical protein